MAYTPLTSSTTYLGVSEFLKRADARTVGDLVSDDGTRVASSSLSGNANLAAALLDASGEVEAAAMKGARYTPADLAALTGAGQARLYRLVTRLTLVYLYERRPDGREKPSGLLDDVTRQLQELRDGVMIFGTTETADAQVMEATTETAQDVVNRDGTVFQAGRYFGRRGNRFGRP